MELPKLREFITPEPEDTWQTLAKRVFPSMEEQEAVEKLQSWNLHMLGGRKPKGVILGSDLIFIEPPTTKVQHMFPGKKVKN